MPSGLVDSDLPTSARAEDPQFDHAIRPWLPLGIVAVITLVLVALFVYGQVAPGA